MPVGLTVGWLESKLNQTCCQCPVTAPVHDAAVQTQGAAFICSGLLFCSAARGAMTFSTRARCSVPQTHSGISACTSVIPKVVMVRSTIGGTHWWS